MRVRFLRFPDRSFAVATFRIFESRRRFQIDFGKTSLQVDWTIL